MLVVFKVVDVDESSQLALAGHVSSNFVLLLVIFLGIGGKPGNDLGQATSTSTLQSQATSAIESEMTETHSKLYG